MKLDKHNPVEDLLHSGGLLLLEHNMFKNLEVGYSSH
jgi:hypothetical protein